jgi:hypothetical protein
VAGASLKMATVERVIVLFSGGAGLKGRPHVRWRT